MEDAGKKCLYTGLQVLEAVFKKQADAFGQLHALDMRASVAAEYIVWTIRHCRDFSVLSDKGLEDLYFYITAYFVLCRLDTGSLARLMSVEGAREEIFYFCASVYAEGCRRKLLLVADTVITYEDLI